MAVQINFEGVRCVEASIREISRKLRIIGSSPSVQSHPPTAFVMHSVKVAPLLALLAFFLPESSSFFWRRRRCSAVNCAVNSWQSWLSCNCISQTKVRYRSKYRTESCGGGCTFGLRDQTSCCCSTNCLMNTWSSWGGCNSTCSSGSRFRYRSVVRSSSCGGSSCSSVRVESTWCNNRCCPVNCRVSSWSSWTAECPCETVAVQYRNRTVLDRTACGGASCPSLQERRYVDCGCCARNCTWTWSSWSSCSRTCGRGFQTRKTVEARAANCSGLPCPILVRSQNCSQYNRRDCQVNEWSSYGRCYPTNGRCGNGTKTRYRSIRTLPLCNGLACPEKRQLDSCWAGCCSVNCTVSSWSSWGPCSTDCGSGLKYQTRHVVVSDSCGGSSCPVLQRSTSCKELNPRTCNLTDWSPWSVCSNQCGKGQIMRTRSVVAPAFCGGTCPKLTETANCTSYEASQNCTVSEWKQWAPCSEGCAVGSSHRQRTILRNQYCRGAACPPLVESKPCGLANGGCQHNCVDAGICSCNSGYVLDKDERSCHPRDCRLPSVAYCPNGTTNGTSCVFATFLCNNGTTYGKTCIARCPSGYTLQNGPSEIMCQSFGAWTAYQTSFCSRINRPPSTILLSNDSVSENVEIEAVVGTFTTLDPNPFDAEAHRYRLINNASGRFGINGSSLVINFSPNYETQPNSYEIIVRTTDSRGLYLDRAFSIRVLDVNEAPSSVKLSNSYVDENSAEETTIGWLSTTDQDSGQNHTYTLQSNPDGLFGISGGNALGVAVSNSRCLAEGGAQCLLNYEASNSYVIRVRSKDSGFPSLYRDESFVIRLRDVNDQPRNIELSGDYTMNENAAVGTVIGNFSAFDEDVNQTLTCTLRNDANGRFAIEFGFKLVRKTAGDIDYEQQVNHTIQVRCRDNGIPSMFLDGQYTIQIADVNEAPTHIGLTSYSVKENLAVSSLVGAITSVDPDNEVEWKQEVEYRLDDNGGNVPFAVDGSDLITTKKLNYEMKSRYVFNVTATDTGTPPSSATVRIAISVEDVNDSPTRTRLVSNGVEENSPGAVVGALVADDEDKGQNHTFEIVPSGAAIFFVSGNRLMVYTDVNLDFESERFYTVSILTIDSGSPPLSRINDVLVRVLDVNDRPTRIDVDSRDEIDENSPSGTPVANVTIIDQDVNQTHVCFLLNGSEYFTRVNRGSSSSEIVVADGADINYEKASSIPVLIRCSDNGRPPLSVDHDVFVVRVADVNERTKDILLTGSLEIREDTPVGTLIGNLTAVDEDRGQKHEFSLSGPLAGAFEIRRHRELVIVRPIQKFFGRLKNDLIIHLIVVVFDDGLPSLGFSRKFAFTVTDVNDAPVNVTVREGTEVYENATAGYRIGTLNCFNSDDDSPISYELLSVDGVSNSKEFYLVNVSETFYLYLNRSLDYDDESSFILEILAGDSGSPPASAISFVEIDVRRVDPCALGTAECHPNGTCFRVNQTAARCECNEGFKGDGVLHCDGIDHCRDTTIDVASMDVNSSKPTLCNNGTCVDNVGSYSCKCPAGYSLPDCSREVDECASNPCGANGVCTDSLNSFTCRCKEGYGGLDCRENIDDCRSSPCDLAGTCYDGIGTFFCSCPSGYTGDVCSFPQNVCRGKCAESTCVPKAIDAATIVVATDGRPGTALSSGFNGDNNNQKYVCVSSQYVVELPFSAELNASGVDFQHRLERYLRADLYVSVPDPDDGSATISSRISATYIVDSTALASGGTSLRLVVLVNNEPVKVTTALAGLYDECMSESSMEATFGKAAKMTCQRVSSALMAKSISSISSSQGTSNGKRSVTVGLICAVGVSVAVNVLIIGFAVVYVRKKRKVNQSTDANQEGVSFANPVYTPDEHFK